ncbi:hypothetical protein GGR53DRAFT_64283 [Hypoxylon sp. FL1150]|nr:hypothetical protein GGR53DRAFT_64283 [Hypoxylon sp. FL1150]
MVTDSILALLPEPGTKQRDRYTLVTHVLRSLHNTDLATWEMLAWIHNKRTLPVEWVTTRFLLIRFAWTLFSDSVFTLFNEVPGIGLLMIDAQVDKRDCSVVKTERTTRALRFDKYYPGLRTCTSLNAGTKRELSEIEDDADGNTDDDTDDDSTNSSSRAESEYGISQITGGRMEDDPCDCDYLLPDTETDDGSVSSLDDSDCSVEEFDFLLNPDGIERDEADEVKDDQLVCEKGRVINKKKIAFR